MKNFSPIIAGTMTWGQWGKNLDTKTMAGRIEECLALGISTFDHADIYGGYTTEAEFGAAFKASKVHRESLQLISKCGIQYPCEQRPLAVKHYDYSPEHIQNSVEQSLKNLHTEYLDVLLLHRPSPLMDAALVVETLEKLVAQGKILAWGVSNFTPSQLHALAAHKTPIWNQIECSLTHTSPLMDGTLDTHQQLHVGSMAWSPLGNYFKEQTPAVERIKSTMGELSEKYNCTASQLLLAWLLKHPAGILPVVGTTVPDRLEAALAATKIELALEDWFTLTEASWGHRFP
jgi:predicted oxidoreductase